MSADEAAENGLTERDSQWPWRGLHEIEEHHPLMKGAEFRDYWKARGFTNEEIEAYTVEMDKDIHQALHNSGMWEAMIQGKIADAEAKQNGVKLNKQQVLEIVEDLLDEVARLFGGQ